MFGDSLQCNLHSALVLMKDQKKKKREKESTKNSYLGLWLMELENVLANVLYLAVDLQQHAFGFKYSA